MKITLTKNFGLLALSAWLILTGLGAFGVSVPGMILAVLAVAAGVLILIGR